MSIKNKIKQINNKMDEFDEKVNAKLDIDNNRKKIGIVLGVLLVLFAGIMAATVETDPVHINSDDIDQPDPDKDVESTNKNASQLQAEAMNFTYNASVNTTELGKQLKKEQMVLFATSTCPHCIKQKRMFGDNYSEKFVYINCDGDKKEQEICSNLNIRTVPTWVDFDDHLYIKGEQTPEKLWVMVNNESYQEQIMNNMTKSDDA